jgi:hypothetical protein
LTDRHTLLGQLGQRLLRHAAHLLRRQRPEWRRTVRPERDPGRTAERSVPIHRLGTGTSQIKFIGASSITLTGGSGQATVTADAGTNKFVAGTGTLDVTGGGGKDAYVFHANGGLLKLEDFSIAKGDTLTVDKTLQGAMHQASDGQGGTMITFGGGATHGVDIHGTATMPTTSVHWA